MVLATEQLDEIDKEYYLAGYPKSHAFNVGYELGAAKHIDAAVGAFKRGADNKGCVPCIVLYVQIQQKHGNFHLLLPYVLEGAIRGHVGCMNLLVNWYQRKAQPLSAMALSSLWTKIMTHWVTLLTAKRRGRESIKWPQIVVMFLARKKRRIIMM